VARSPNPSFLSPQYQGSDSATKRNISSLEDSASKTTPNGKSFSVPASPSGRSGQKNRSRVEDEVDLVFREMESSRRQSVERAVEEQVAFLAQREREMRNRTQELIQQREAESAAREEQAAEENARVQAENDRALELRLQQLRINSEMKHSRADQNLNEYLRQKEAEEAERRRREAEAAAAAQRAREEAERKRREEEAARAAAAEAARKKAEAEAQAAAAKRAQEEEARKRAEQQRLAQQQQQQQAAQPQAQAQPAAKATAAAPAAAPGAATGSTDSISGSSRFNFAKMKTITQASDQTMAAMEQHPKRRDIFKVVHLNCNQITNMRAQIQNKIGVLGQVLNGSRTAGELEYRFCIALIAQKLVDQCEILISRQPSSAWGVAHTLVPLALQHPLLLDFVLAQLYNKCPYAVPCYPKRTAQESDDEFL
jgi:chemotaxis protein histidine kinase CheA